MAYRRPRRRQQPAQRQQRQAPGRDSGTTGRKSANATSDPYQKVGADYSDVRERIVFVRVVAIAFQNGSFCAVPFGPN